MADEQAPQDENITSTAKEEVVEQDATQVTEDEQVLAPESEHESTNDELMDSLDHVAPAAIHEVGWDDAFSIQATQEHMQVVVTDVQQTESEVEISFEENHTTDDMPADSLSPTDLPLEATTLEVQNQAGQHTPPDEISREHSLMDNDEEDSQVEAVERLEAKTQDDKGGKDEPSLGAQILMNRFSTWRQIAKETVSTNAQTILQSKVGQQLATRANETTKTLNATTKTFFATAKPTTATTTSSVMSEEGEGSSSFEEEGTATEDDTDDKSHHSETSHDSGVALPEVAAAVAVRSAAHAATSVVESVATGFRGRYTGNSSHVPEPPGGTKSQTALILQSRAASHMQGILGSLDESHEYVMLLGNGMLGVNLKQSYLRNHGVYIDYLVGDGHAHKSGVVFVGDTIIKVGDKDVTRGTILNIPQIIATSKRPTVMTFSTGQKTTLDRVNYVDIAIAMMHRIRSDQNKRRDIARMPLNISSGVIKQSKSDDAEDPPLDWSAPVHSLDTPDPANIPTLPIAAKATLTRHLPKRGNDKFSLSMLLQANASIENFRTILRFAFITCAMDGRRLPFLAEKFSSEHSFETVEYKVNEDLQKSTASTQLILFLELMSFVELYDATPLPRRRDIAKKIAYKFFLPTRIGNKMEQPLFDFSHIVSKAELNALVMAINDKNLPISRSLFLPFQNATTATLSGAPFLNFLMSNDCARMRGYLRNTAPYHTISPTAIIHAAVENDSHDAHNHFMYTLLHLLCQNERDVGGENANIMSEKMERVLGGAGGLCCAIFIKKRMRRVMEMAKPLLDSDPLTVVNSEPFASLVTCFEFLWEVFVSPDTGAVSSLPHSNETGDSLEVVRKLLEEAARFKEEQLLPFLIHENVQSALDRLAGDLVYDYAVNAYPKFKEHKFHEWLCTEITNTGPVQDCNHPSVPPLPDGSVKRLLRKAELPAGLSAHKPIRKGSKLNDDIMRQSRAANREHERSSEPNILATYPNAQIAVVFGTDDGLDAERVPNPAMDNYDIRRYIAETVELEGIASPSISKCRIPPTLESYATVPLMRRTPFSTIADQSRVSADGWEVSLVDFKIPSAESSESEDGALYGVSLVFQRKDLTGVGAPGDETPTVKLSFDPEATTNPVTPQKERTSEVLYDNDTGEAIDISAFASPISFFSPEETGSEDPYEPSQCTINVSADVPIFNRRLSERQWTTRIDRHRAAQLRKSSVTIGVALVSSQNVIFAMRTTLSRLLLDFAKGGESNITTLKCTPLVEILGNFSHNDVERHSLKCILEPYLRFGLKQWVERPFRSQNAEYDLAAGQQLIECLPPIPLGLLFVAIMLEQKIIISSNRRSSLLAALTGVVQLLQPLKWAHLLVPLAPVALARDLLQYPAPFIIGLPSEDPGNMRLLNNLPDDVTLVDLDVGRVILAPTIAYDEAMLRESEDRATAGGALRSQILYLAQSLGILFGSKLRRSTWCSDSPMATVTPTRSVATSDFSNLKEICRAFLTELLTGVSACCYWIEEATLAPEGNDCTVLFDEDRFFSIKNVRARQDSKSLFASKSNSELSMSLDDFDLIIECFLRCQSLSTFVSSRPKEIMAFC